jgi:hypothetical protein
MNSIDAGLPDLKHACAYVDRFGISLYEADCHQKD